MMVLLVTVILMGMTLFMAFALGAVVGETKEWKSCAS